MSEKAIRCWLHRNMPALRSGQFSLAWMSGAIYSTSCSLISWPDYTMASFFSTCFDLRGFRLLKAKRIKNPAPMPSFFPILGPNSVYGVMKNSMNDKNCSTESVSGSLD